MNFIEEHFTDGMVNDPIRMAICQQQIDDFDTVAEFDRVVSLINEDPNKFMKLIKMAEIILSVRDVLWKDTAGNC
jgi:hypothetical protein